MDFETLKKKYLNIPQEMTTMKRWVCYTIVKRDGDDTKVPVNAITGDLAKSNDKETWTTFVVAIRGCVKYNLEGIGFMLGDGFFGVDLDNHPDKKTGKTMPEDEFNALSKEFIDGLDSYSEYSRSGKGIHIICCGSLPEGRRRKGNVEMYDFNRFFAMTGNVINQKAPQQRDNEIIPLWKKYVDDSADLARMKAEQEKKNQEWLSTHPGVVNPIGNSVLSDTELLEKARSAKNGQNFSALYDNGDMSFYSDDHSSADYALCSMLAFWCNGDKVQIDRLFRGSKLMREKWDAKRGETTYGSQTIDKAVNSMANGYQPVVEKTPYVAPVIIEKERKEAASPENYMNIDEKGDPIFRIPKVVKEYEFTDTGNAERFYDYFGSIFKFNKDDKVYMFWTGKTWVCDSKNIIVKYANKLIEIMQDEVASMYGDIASAEDDEGKKMKARADAASANVKRLANKAGKDAMLNELQSIHDMPCINSEFDNQEYLLNTQSGVVDLRTGKLQPFDKGLMLSKNTGVEISFEEPVIWIKFLHGIFDRSIANPNNPDKAKKETDEIIECFQRCVGYSLTASTREQVMFLLYGSGSNGKSTFTTEMAKIMGDYGKSIDSNLLMSQKGGTNPSIQFSLAELTGARYLTTQETDEGAKLAEGTIKNLTGSDKINAQRKYGRPFEFIPKFKIWMMTNNLPIIRGTDFGIWRRIFLFPFLKNFKDDEKDLDLPEKLEKESDKILGWCVKGCLKYLENGRLEQPQCLKDAIQSYKDDMDVVSKFVNRQCNTGDNLTETCTNMYNSFKQWAAANNEFPLRESKFRAELIKKGHFVVDTGNAEAYYTKIKLRSSVVVGPQYIGNKWEDLE